jgi:hypothetical protein
MRIHDSTKSWVSSQLQYFFEIHLNGIIVLLLSSGYYPRSYHGNFIRATSMQILISLLSLLQHFQQPSINHEVPCYDQYNMPTKSSVRTKREKTGRGGL